MLWRMRLLAPEVPVVFASGYTAEYRGLPLDAQTVFVPKPYTLTPLGDAIDGVVAA